MDYIVILERTSLNPQTVRFIMRADVPAARQPYFADPEKASAFPGISAGDLSALRAGEFIERTDTVSTGTLTIAQVGAALVAAQQAFQAAVTADGEYNPYRFYGSTWDGTAWTLRGVA